KGAKRKSTASLIYIFVTAHLDQNVISLHANRLLQSRRDQFDHSRQGGHIARGLHFVRSAQLGDLGDLVTHLSISRLYQLQNRLISSTLSDDLSSLHCLDTLVKRATALRAVSASCGVQPRSTVRAFSLSFNFSSLRRLTSRSRTARARALI